MSSNPGDSGVVKIREMLGEPLFCWGVGLGLMMPSGQLPPNVAVGLLASFRILYGRNLQLYTSSITIYGRPLP